MIEAHLTSPTSIRCGDIEVKHRVPIYTLCRELLSRGVTGTLVVYGCQGTRSLTVDIEWGARYTIKENNQGMQRAKYCPFSKTEHNDE